MAYLEPGIISSVDFLFITTCLSHKIRIGTVVLHPGGICLDRIFVELPCDQGVDHAVLLGLTVAESTAHQPSIVFIAVHKTVRADVESVGILPKGCLDRVLLRKHLDPCTILRPVANFA